MTPYYFVNSGSRIAFVRMGDESVVATAHQLSGLVLKGRNVTYDSLSTEYTLKEMSFDALAKTYEKQTGSPFQEKLLRSFSLITDKGFLTNAGVLFQTNVLIDIQVFIVPDGRVFIKMMPKTLVNIRETYCRCLMRENNLWIYTI